MDCRKCVRTSIQISHKSEIKARSNVTNKQKKRRTTDIRPSCIKPAKKSSVYKLIECVCDDRAEIK